MNFDRSRAYVPDNRHSALDLLLLEDKQRKECKQHDTDDIIEDTESEVHTENAEIGSSADKCTDILEVRSRCDRNRSAYGARKIGVCKRCIYEPSRKIRHKVQDKEHHCLDT